MQSSTANPNGNGEPRPDEGESTNVHASEAHVSLPLNDSGLNRQAEGVLPPMYFGENPNKKTLVLDLDGTLLHADFKPAPGGYDFTLSLEGYDEPLYVWKRPGVDKLLQELGSTGLYEIVIFTAGLECYANAVVDKILDLLPPSQHATTNTSIIPRTHRLDRRHCSQVEGIPDAVKDLSILGRDLKNVIIVDDRRTSYYLQPQNAIEIDSWTGDNPDDDSLFRVLSFLLEIQDPECPYAALDDVREVMKLMKQAYLTQEHNKKD